MDKDTILDYVMSSPENTNRAVLSSMLDSMGGGEMSSILIVNQTYDYDNSRRILDKTWKEIDDAVRSGIVCVSMTTFDIHVVTELIGIVNKGNQWSSNNVNINNTIFTATTVDDYPESPLGD